MIKVVYNWKRFWYPRGSTIELLDSGYLYSPDEEWAHLLQPNLVSLESLSHIPCLILLGEPGIGKSSELRKQEIFTREQLTETTLRFDLGGYQTDDRLHKELFEHPVFHSWRAGTHRLHLFLDGLDEGLLTISVLAKLLSRNFQKYPVQRLYLRIACRTAEWSLSLEESLKQLWGEENVGIHQLAPLRRVDVSEAAVAHGLNSEQFLDEVARREVVSLAIKPLTLRFLFNIYREKGIFPSTQVELYKEGCQLLCEEMSESRRDAGLTGNLDSEQRLAVASRIAALMVFTNRSAVWTDVDQGNVPESDIKHRELWGAKEHLARREVDVSESALREALATGLFASRGPRRLGWAHRTYAEFLAAWYLVQHQVTVTQIMSLLVHSDGIEKRLIPQLHETSAWLATMRSDVFRQIIQIDPEVLLRSDVATADERDRAGLVKALLNLHDEARLIYLHRNYGHLYGKLLHSSLPTQLFPYISESTFSEAVRLTAINIAEACGLRTLQERLVDIALDSSQPQLIREEAAQAVVRIGDAETKAKLKILAEGMGEGDPNDQLKGYTLLAIWPVHMTAAELFAALTPAKRDNFIGAYQRFLASQFIEYLQPTDLPIALNWVEKLPSRSEMRYQYGELFKIADAIMLQAWRHLDVPKVLEAFARAVISRFEHYDDILVDIESQELTSLIEDDGKRRLLLDTVFRLLAERQGDPIPLLYRKPLILLQRDVPWLFEYLLQEEAEELQQVVVRLISYAFNENDADLVGMVFAASENNAILASQFAWLLKPVELGSPEARKLQKDYSRRQQLEEWQKERSRHADVPSMERIVTLLDECEQSNISVWARLCWEMTYRPDGSVYRKEFDQTTFPGWDIVDAAVRKRMLEIAKKYVLEQAIESYKWLGTNKIPYATWVMYKTLQLLMKETPDFIHNLPLNQWKKLVSVILTWSNPTDVKIDHELVRMTYQFAQDEVIETTLLLIEREDKQFGSLHIIQKIEFCWDERLAQALLEKVKDDTLKPGSIEHLLTDLLEHHVEHARAFALSLVSSQLTDEQGRAKAIVAAKSLLMYAEDAGWSAIWPLMQRDDDFGMKLVAKVAQSSSGQAPQQLTEDQLADLYIWLVRRYPPSQYPIDVEASFAGVADSIALWRDTLLGYLKERGTFQACDAIRRIAREVPELVDQLTLKWVLLEAENLARRRTWRPYSPEEILRVVNDSQLRLVQNGEQLLEVVIESLKRLEAKFHDETPAWRDVWDRIPVASGEQNAKGKSRKRLEYEYRPIDENDFSDYIKRHLEGDLRQKGVIANREVVIRKDERTDIHVDAVMRNSQREIYDTVSIIIEVKGCWNRELFTAMKEQLVERYLKDNHCKYGLYIIGWFNCGEWDSGDYRKGDAPNMPIEEAQRKFDAQAAELSQQGINIRALVLNAAVR